MIDFGPLHLSKNLSSDSVKIGITANSGLHTNELICGVSFALEDELAVGNQTAKDISFVWKNDGRCASKASQVAEEFAKEGVRFVIGHLSASASVPASQIYTRTGVCFFATGTTHPELCKENKPYVLRFCPLDTEQAELIVNLLDEVFYKSEAYLIVQDIKYAHALSNLILTKNNNKKVSVLHVNENNLREQLGEVASLPDDSILVVCAIHEYAANYINELVSCGYRGKFILGDDCDIPNFHRLLNCSDLQMYIPKINFSKRINKYLNRDSLDKRYYFLRKESPGAYFYTSYVACRLLIHSMECFKSINSDKIYQSLISNKELSELWLPITFDAQGNSKEIEWKMSFSKEK